MEVAIDGIGGTILVIALLIGFVDIVIGIIVTIVRWLK